MPARDARKRSARDAELPGRRHGAPALSCSVPAACLRAMSLARAARLLLRASSGERRSALPLPTRRRPDCVGSSGRRLRPGLDRRGRVGRTSVCSSLLIRRPHPPLALAPHGRRRNSCRAHQSGYGMTAVPCPRSLSDPAAAGSFGRRPSRLPPCASLPVSCVAVVVDLSIRSIDCPSRAGSTLQLPACVCYPPRDLRVRICYHNAIYRVS